MQEIISGLLIVLVPMALGYCIVVKNKTYLAWVDKMVMVSLYLLLFMMGFMLGQLDDLAQKLPVIGLRSLSLAVIILLCNAVGLWLYDRKMTQPALNHNGKVGSQWGTLWESLELSFTVVAGIILGWLCQQHFHFPHDANMYVLVAMIFFVGIQLRNNGISLKSALLNKQGFVMAIIFTATCLVGGALSAWILQIPVAHGLAFASGFGWYSLSSVVITNAWGPVQGSIAFFNDLIREIASLFIIPLLIRRYCATAVGISGATALDSTFPIIQKSGGLAVTPIAISFGIVTNILPPILLVLFSSWRG